MTQPHGATTTRRGFEATTQLVRSRVDDAVRSSRFIIHPPGWAAIGFLVCSLITALTWHWIEAGAVVLFLAVVLLVAVAVALAPVTVRVDVEFEKSRVVVGKVSVAHLRATAGSRPTRATIVNVPVGELTASFLVPPLRAREQWREPFVIPTERRQVLQLGPATATRADALGLLSRDTVLSNQTELYVHPQTIAPGYAATGLLRDLEGVTAPMISPSDIAFHALRDYAPGDDRRHVHWPTSARLGRLVVREFEQTRRSEHLVVADLRRDSYDSDAAAELAISIGTSYGIEAVLLHRTASIRLGHHELSTVSPMRLLDESSPIEFVADGPTLPQLVHSAARTRPQVSAVTIITGERPDRDEVAAAVRTVPVSARPLVLRAAAEGRVVRRMVAEAPQFTISELAELRRISEVMAW